MRKIRPLTEINASRFETTAILKALAGASRALAELKGVASSIPSAGILVNTLGLQEAKDSTAIENIVTTHDQLFRDAITDDAASPTAKEVLRYRQAMWTGFTAIQKRGLVTINDILKVHEKLELNSAGFRKVPGTALKNGRGEVVYTPPLPDVVPAMMSDLEKFMNTPEAFDADPLIKMALMHHQFESIHPFYDGNGRTGRILNVLYLVTEGLLDIPILYMSRQIVRTKDCYYQLLQSVRKADAWEAWVEYMLSAVEVTAREGIQTVNEIKSALLDVKHKVRTNHPKIYSQDLINSLFDHPYTRIQFIQDDLGVSRITATRYLDLLAADGTLEKHRFGRSTYYINRALNAVLTRSNLSS